MGAFMQRQKKKRKLKQAMRDRLMEKRVGAEEQRKTAKLSKKQAKKLKKIYGDLNPEELNAINEIQPYVGSMADQLQEAGVEVENPEDAIEVGAKYNTEILEEEAPEGYEAFDGFTEGFDKEKAKGILKIGMGAIAGAFGAAKANAESRAMKGEPLTQADKAVISLKEAEAEEIKKRKSQTIGDTVSKILPVAAVALLAYLIFKN